MESGPSETRAVSSPSHPLDPHGFAPGHILADRYRIVALVGRGGMGEVYRADDLKLGQPVALKFLPAALERDPAARDRLLAEVRSARTVSHPNVCRVYDVGDIGGRVFLTMEYIDGEDLASLLRRIGRLPVAKALEVARQLCAGLAAAHDKGVLHRDLKPANVMIDGRGHARITDFGLAVSAGAAATPADFAGTLAYMAPERFRGTPATVQSDLYGLGLILYETYTGKSPFKAGSVQEWERAHTDSTPSSPSALASEIEPAVDRAILRCLEKDPTKRPASAAQVAAALPGGDPLAAALAAGETPSPGLVAASGEEGTLPRVKAWLWLAACLIALAVVPFTLMPFSLAEHVALNLSPDALQTKAREVLQQIGYPDQPADRAWWFRTDDEYLDRVNRLRPREAADELRNAVPGPMRFCYRQSPAPLVPAGVFRMFGVSVLGQVTATDPPLEVGDAYLELDPGGRLAAMQLKPAAYGSPQPSSGVDWETLFDVAKLGPPRTCPVGTRGGSGSSWRLSSPSPFGVSGTCWGGSPRSRPARWTGSAASLCVLDKVATGGYHDGMNPVRTVGVKELRNRLSEYLRDVRRGTRVLVTDRNAVVAEFRQPGPDSRADERHPRAAEWLDSGVLIAPSRPKLPLPRSPVTLPAGTACAIVDALRDETRP